MTARNKLITSNMRLIGKLARAASGGDNDLCAELVAVGVAGTGVGRTSGLMRAIEKFDPTRGTSFGTYATPWVRAAFRDHFARTSPLGFSGRACAGKARKFVRETIAAEGSEPSLDAVATHLCVSPTVAARLLMTDNAARAMLHHAAHKLPSADVAADATLEAKQAAAATLAHVAALPPLTARVVTLRHGLGRLRGEGLTARSTAAALGVSLTVVTRLYFEGMQALREAIGSAEESEVAEGAPQ